MGGHMPTDDSRKRRQRQAPAPRRGARAKTAPSATQAPTGAGAKLVANKTPIKKALAKQAVRAPIKPILDLSKIWDDLRVARPIQFRVSFARPDDLLVCDFVFDNLELVGDELVRTSAALAATLIVEFQPQSFGEQAF